MKNNLKATKLGASVIHLYILSWDGTGAANSKGLSDVKSDSLKEAIGKQLGVDVPTYFEKSFVNYVLGYILCVNSPAFLNKFFNEKGKAPVEPPPPDPAGTPNPAGTPKRLADSIRFTAVKMPKEFIGKGSSLSSKYALGEKLAVRAAIETTKDEQNGKKKREMTYRDTNSKGRSRLASKGGAAAAVWS